MIDVATFTAEARRFLDANASRRSGESEKFVWGEGSDSVGMLEERSEAEERERVNEAKAWKAKEFDAGFGWITGPEEYGGRALTGEHERAYRGVASEYWFPSQQPFLIGLGMIAPTILAHAIPEVRERYLRALYRGDIIACQLFSEPVAGSDLAGVQARAVRDGDEWVITGQKVWTSGAQYSDIGEVLTVSSPDKPRHRNLTMFVVDMRAPGVEVRPLRQMTGGAAFNEVFFDEVRVPDSHRLGDVDAGWGVALTTLMNERAAISGGGGGSGLASVTRFVELARHFDRTDDPIVRDAVARLYELVTVSRLNSQRAAAKTKAGQTPGPEGSLGKMSLTAAMHQGARVVTEILGPRLVADTGEWGTFAWGEYIMGICGMRIAGGTDEIMRNIVGERVLGLPKT